MSSVRLVGEPQELAELGIGRGVLVADQRDGAGRASGRGGQRRPRYRRACAAARARVRTRAGSRRCARPTSRSAVRANTRPAARTPVWPLPASWSRPATSRSGSVTPSARSEATTSSPCRWSATCIGRRVRAERASSRPPVPLAPPARRSPGGARGTGGPYWPTRSVRKAFRIGSMIRRPIESPGGKNRMTIRMMNPYCSRNGRTW